MALSPHSHTPARFPSDTGVFLTIEIPFRSNADNIVVNECRDYSASTNVLEDYI